MLLNTDRRKKYTKNFNILDFVILLRLVFKKYSTNCLLIVGLFCFLKKTFTLVQSYSLHPFYFNYRNTFFKKQLSLLGSKVTELQLTYMDTS